MSILLKIISKFRSLAEITIFACCLSSLFSTSAFGATSGETIVLHTDVGASPPITNQPHIQVRLVSEHEVFARGETSFIGLHLVPDPEWHVYWRNPGDSGLAPQVQWSLPEGASTSDIAWPWPKQLPLQHLMNYGYDGEVIFPVALNIPNNVTNEAFTIKAEASWLVCKEECIPGSTSLILTLPVGDKQKKSRYAESITSFRNREPKTLSLTGSEFNVDSHVEMTLYAKQAVFKDAKDIKFFPIQENLVENGKKAELRWKNNLLTIRQAKSTYYTGVPGRVEGVLVVDGSAAWQFSLQP